MTAPAPMPAATVRLLWTAGWDSTFRLLSALLVHRKAVQPYYLTDPARPSTDAERRAMERIAAALAARFPDAAAHLRPPIISSVADLQPDAAITGPFERLRARSPLGGQYDWLARFAEQQGLTDLELAIHQDDRAAGFLGGAVVGEPNDGDPYYRLRDDPPDPDLRLFERFRFPLFDTTKLAMQRAARAHGFADLMELTWFCHSPTAKGEPCGNCNPCRWTIDEGLGRRIPLPNRVQHYRRRITKQVKRPLRAIAKWTGLR